MKVLFDTQIFDLQKYGGISRYFAELIKELNLTENVEYYLPIVYSNNEYLKDINVEIKLNLIKDPYEKFMFGLEFKGKRKVYNLVNKLFLHQDNNIVNRNKVIQLLKEGNFDIFHPTYYDDYFMEYIGDKPFVLTIYDTIHQIFPEFLANSYPDKSLRLLSKASHIISISNNTKQDLISIYDIDEEKITVAHLGNSLNIKKNMQITIKAPKNFFLFVGSRSGYKNFLFFARVFKLFSINKQDLYLICTGDAFNSQEIEFFEKIELTQNIIHFNASDNELVHLYSNAIAFVFPSMYEGFGLPILEAFSCGCPVLCSDTSSFPEVAGDAAIYFKPKNVKSLLEALEAIYNDGTKRKDLILLGYNQLKKFSWSDSSINTINVYEDVIKNYQSSI